MKVIGIDLAGKEENPSGISILKNHIINTSHIHSDEEIVRKCEKVNPNLIGLDAPLSFPEEDGFREIDSKLVKRGYGVLPPTLGGMRSLTERGIKLAEKFRILGLEVIEVHPRTSGLILFDTESREEWLLKLSESGWKVKSEMDEHEIDSIMAALTGYLCLEGSVEKISAEGEGEIIIPRGPWKDF